MVKFMTMFLVLFGVIAAGSGLDCCSRDQVLTRDKRCRDENTLIKTPVKLTCTEHTLVNGSRFKFFLNDRGQLEFPVPNRRVVHDDYCVFKTNGSETLNALVCDEPAPAVDDRVMGSCMLVSVCFLLATVGTYVHWGFYRSIFDKSVINLCVSLALALLILAVMKLMSYTDMNWCAVRGFSAYYFVLVSFFWMNAISLQTITARRNGEAPGASADDRRRWYAVSAVYAWGAPAALTALTALVNYLPGDHLKPGIGLNHCWFFDVSMQWEYMYSMMSVLTVINIIVFTILCCSECSQHESFKNKFAKRVQLFVVMGIPWIFEMIGSLAPNHLAWEILDILNSLQGVWIFVVLVLLRSQRPVHQSQYNRNIISAELPYYNLDK